MLFLRGESRRTGKGDMLEDQRALGRELRASRKQRLKDTDPGESQAQQQPKEK